MANLRITKHASVEIDSNVVAVGSLSTVQTISVTNIHDQRYTIAASGTQKLFDATEDIADWDFLAVLSTQDVEVEFVAANGANQVMHVEKVKANIPMFKESDDSRDNTHTEDWGADGVAAVFDKITVKNTSAASADVRIILFT